MGGAIAVADYLEEWLERRRSQLRPTTLQGYTSTVRCYLAPTIGDVRLRELDRRRIERLYSMLLVRGGKGGKPLSPRTVQLTHAVLRRALEDAVIDGLLTENPASLARPPKRAQGQVAIDDDLHVWTGRQVARFLHAVDDDPMRAIWHVAVGTGCRRGEILGLRWRDVDLAARVVRIRRSLSVVGGVERLLGTKTSRSRTLSVGPTVIDALERERDEQRALRERAGDGWRNDWGLVFTESDGAPINPMRVTLAFRRLVRRLDVPVIRLHDLRHTHASLLLEQNVPIKVVSERLGHATITMTMDVYAHLLPAMDADAVARLEASIGSHSSESG